MNRIFITINFEKIKIMCNDTPLHSKCMVLENTPFTSIDNVIILSDEFINWENYHINKDHDYILFHTTSTNAVEDNIQLTFKKENIIYGSHTQNSNHYKALEIIFDDSLEKTNRILTDLFKKIRAQEAFIQMYKSISLAYIISLNGKDTRDAISKFEGHYNFLKSYLKHNDILKKIQIELQKDPTDIKFIKATFENACSELEKALYLNQP